ncbi:MAG: hypothetical protein ABIA76_03490, partial [Candidatus Diapherotrites archaeon]
FPPEKENYVLLKPYAYSIGENLIAMRRVDFPSVDEILARESIDSLSTKNITERGANFFSKIKKKHTVSESDLQKAVILVGRRTKITTSNLLLVGFEKGKFIFIPLADLF